MAESIELMDKEHNAEMLTFVRKFVKTKPGDAEETRENIEGLGLMKLDDKSISKIIDLLPENEEDLSKIFIGIGLDEEESKRVLEGVKGCK